jgi:hypothetical protein
MERRTVMGNQVSETNKQKSFNLLAVIVIIAVIIVVGAVAFFVYEKLQSKPGESTVVTDRVDGRGTILTPENMDEVLNAEKVDDGFFETRMSTEWTFINNNSSENVYLANAETNLHTFYFDIAIGDTEKEVVYSSPYVPVGSEMPQFSLEKALDKGDYPATVIYHLVDDENKEISSVSIAVTLHIK